MKFSFFSKVQPALRNISTTATAGAEVNPGDFIPATSINPLTSSFSSIIKSSVSETALRSAKFLIPSLNLKSLNSLLQA